MLLPSLKPKAAKPGWNASSHRQSRSLRWIEPADRRPCALVCVCPAYHTAAAPPTVPPPHSITSSTRRRTLRDYHERCPVDRVSFRQLAGARQPLKIIYQNEVRMFFQLII